MLCLGILKRDEIKFLKKAAQVLSLAEGGGRSRLSLRGQHQVTSESTSRKLGVFKGGRGLSLVG